MDRYISPPPRKRRRLSKSSSIDQIPPFSNDLNIWSWNVNGITPFIDRRKPITSFFSPSKAPPVDEVVPPSLRDILKKYNWPTLLLLQEVKISPNDIATQRAVSRAIRPRQGEALSAPDYVAHFCLPTDEYNARGKGRKVYGVCSLVRKDFYDGRAERVRSVDWDAEGRILICETKASTNMPKLAIINIYAVNGTNFALRDSQTGEITGTRHDRKLAVHRLLQEECRKLEEDGFGVIVAGDINIARTPRDGHPNLRTFPEQHCLNRADFEARFFREGGTKVSNIDINDVPDKVHGLGMIDTFRYLWPDTSGYTYYPRGVPFGDSCDRVDMIICSRSLRENLELAGMIATPGDRATSDHVPLYASFVFPKQTPASPMKSSLPKSSDQTSGGDVTQEGDRDKKRTASGTLNKPG